jgi:hypothetical protein
VPISEPWIPSADAVWLSLDAQQLAAKIHSIDDARRLATAIDLPATQAIEGLPLMAWRYDAVVGCIRFLRFDVAGDVTHVVIAINAPESRRAEFVPENAFYASAHSIPPDRHIVLMVGIDPDNTDDWIVDDVGLGDPT